MCGIVGAISKNTQPAPHETVREMSNDIVHRGPDDAGYWTTDWCSLGFRRLSIIDLSEHGHQPMFDPTGTFLIVYNGEVYNYLALRQELQDQGVEFQSTSDTEVVLQAYIRWGETCLNRLIGMFAFIIVKIPTREVFIARDQLGIKPLYYHETRDHIYFASEIKALRHVTPFKLNSDTLYEQLVFRYVAGESTPFEGIRKFPAGSYWKFQHGQSPVSREFYDVTDSLKSREDVSEEDLLPDIRAGVIDSISAHTASDVGYTVQLSGGVDSSFITAVLAKEFGHELDTYSIVVRGERCDESEFQRMVSKDYSARHHELELDGDDFAGVLEKATWHMDVPIIHMGCVMLMLLCEQSVNTSKVILTGEGADELFNGYNRHLRMSIDGGSSSDFLSNLFGPGQSRLGIPRTFPIVRNLVGRTTQGLLDMQRTLKRPVMESFLSDLEQNTTYREAVVGSQDSEISKELAHDQKCYLESLLDRQDKMSMAASVEARVPFCNPVLFDMLNPVSPALKLKNSTTKYLLKKIGEEYLDRSVLHRRKNGLNLPIEDWLRDGPLSDRLTMLTDQTARERGFYNNRAIEAAIDRYRKREGTAPLGRYLMAFLAFETWMRMFIDNQAGGRA